MHSNQTSGATFATDLGNPLRDFVAFAGRKGVVAAIFVALAALFEGLSLVVLVPLLGIVIGSGLPSGRLGRAVAAMFNLFAVERRSGN